MTRRTSKVVNKSSNQTYAAIKQFSGSNNLSKVLAEKGMSQESLDYLTSSETSVYNTAHIIGLEMGESLRAQDIEDGTKNRLLVLNEIGRARTEVAKSRPKTYLQSVKVSKEKKKAIDDQYAGVVFKELAEAIPNIWKGDKAPNTGTAMVAGSLLLIVGSIGYLSMFTRKHKELLDAHVESFKNAGNNMKAWMIKENALGILEKSFVEGMELSLEDSEININKGATDKKSKKESYKTVDDTNSYESRYEKAQMEREAEQEAPKDAASKSVKDRTNFVEWADDEYYDKIANEFFAKKIAEVKSCQARKKAGEGTGRITLEIYPNGMPRDIVSKLKPNYRADIFDNETDIKHCNTVVIDFEALYDEFCNKEKDGYKLIEKSLQVQGKSIEDMNEAQIMNIALASVSPRNIADKMIGCFTKAYKQLEETENAKPEDYAGWLEKAIGEIHQELLVTPVKLAYGGSNGIGDADAGVNSLECAIACGIKSHAEMITLVEECTKDNSSKLCDVERDRKAISAIAMLGGFSTENEGVSRFFDVKHGVGYIAKIREDEDTPRTYEIQESYKGFIPELENVTNVVSKIKKIDDKYSDDFLLLDDNNEEELDDLLDENDAFSISGESKRVENLVIQTLQELKVLYERHDINKTACILSFLDAAEDGGYILSNEAYDQNAMFTPGYETAAKIASLSDIYRLMEEDMCLKPDESNKGYLASFTNMVNSRLDRVLPFKHEQESMLTVDTVIERLTDKTGEWIKSVYLDLTQGKLHKTDQELEACAKLFKPKGEIVVLLEQIESGNFDVNAFSRESGLADVVCTLDVLAEAGVMYDKYACMNKIAILAREWQQYCFKDKDLNTLGQAAFGSDVNTEIASTQSVFAKSLAAVEEEISKHTLIHDLDTDSFLANDPLASIRAAGVKTNIEKVDVKIMSASQAYIAEEKTKSDHEVQADVQLQRHELANGFRSNEELDREAEEQAQQHMQQVEILLNLESSL